MSCWAAWCLIAASFRCSDKVISDRANLLGNTLFSRSVLILKGYATHTCCCNYVTWSVLIFSREWSSLYNAFGWHRKINCLTSTLWALPSHYRFGPITIVSWIDEATACRNFFNSWDITFVLKVVRYDNPEGEVVSWWNDAFISLYLIRYSKSEFCTKDCSHATIGRFSNTWQDLWVPRS